MSCIALSSFDGSFDVALDRNADVCLVCWIDSKVVTIASTYVGAKPLQKAKRHSSQEKRRIDVDQPKVVHTTMAWVELIEWIRICYATWFNTGSRSGIGQYSTSESTRLSRMHFSSIAKKIGMLQSRSKTCCRSATRLFRSICSSTLLLSPEQLDSSVSTCSPPNWVLGPPGGPHWKHCSLDRVVSDDVLHQAVLTHLSMPVTSATWDCIPDASNCTTPNDWATVNIIHTDPFANCARLQFFYTHVSFDRHIFSHILLWLLKILQFKVVSWFSDVHKYEKVDKMINFCLWLIWVKFDISQ